MTILGCNDGVSQCQYVATAEKTYSSVALCDAATEPVLTRYSNINYPMVIAVCQKPGERT